MTNERRLISIGIPIDDVITICAEMRKDGGLGEYIQAQEAEYRRRCAAYVEDVIA